MPFQMSLMAYGTHMRTGLKNMSCGQKYCACSLLLLVAIRSLQACVSALNSCGEVPEIKKISTSTSKSMMKDAESRRTHLKEARACQETADKV